MQRSLAWLVAAFLCFAATVAAAQDVLPVPPLAGRVVDQTGTLSAAQNDALTAKLAAIEQRRGSQLVVLIVPTTEPEDIAAYGQRVADAWKIGRHDIGDGVLVVVAKNDRRFRVEVAKALEGALPDVLVGRILREQMAPAFKAGDYAGGLNASIDRIDQAIGGEGLAAPSANAARHARPGFDWQDLAIFLFVAVPIVGGILAAIFGRKLAALITGGAIGAVGWWLTASLLVAGGAALVAVFLVGVAGLGRLGRSGVGPVIWGGGGFGGGGGFRSGGGGDFGGGGASGSW